MSERRVVVDVELCESNGVCVTIAPEAFWFDDDGVLHVLAESAADEIWERVDRAARCCPRMAISVIDR